MVTCEGCVFNPHPDVLQEFALKFVKFADRISSTPTIARNEEGGRWSFSQDDLPLSDRIRLLLEWWEASGDVDFMKAALALLDEGTLELVSWRDGQSLPEIHWLVSNFVDHEHPLKRKLLEGITQRLLAVIEGGLTSDELINVIKNVREYMNDAVRESIEDAIAGAVHCELYETDEAISHLDSEQSLAETLRVSQYLGRTDR